LCASCQHLTCVGIRGVILNLVGTAKEIDCFLLKVHDGHFVADHVEKRAIEDRRDTDLARFGVAVVVKLFAQLEIAVLVVFDVCELRNNIMLAKVIAQL
jgi:hypothetical protein